MKTHVIHLVGHDDIVSVRDKMSWSKSERILLVFPDHARILPRDLDLLLLKRHAAHLGAQMALVASSRWVRIHCTRLGVPVFADLASARSAEWGGAVSLPHPSRHLPRIDLRLRHKALSPDQPAWRIYSPVRLLFFLLGFSAVLAILVTFLPTASIALVPEMHYQVVSIPVHASLDVTDVALAGAVPADALTLPLRGSQTIASSGLTSIPIGFAEGLARFENLSVALVGIPAGTVVRTLDVPAWRFATLEDAILPAGVGQTLQIPVRALVAGPGGNLPVGALASLEGLLGADLAVTNPQPFTGGSDAQVPSPTPADQDSLRLMLLDALAKRCQENLLPLLPPGAVTSPDALELQVLAETFLPGEAQPGETLSLVMDVECTTLYTDQADLQALAVAVLDANLPVGFTPLDAPILEQGGMTLESGTLRWEMTASRPIQLQVDPAAIGMLVNGQRPSQAVETLQSSLSLGQPPFISLQPNWWPWLPAIPFRITILVGQ